jgi:hypothetical protein
LFAPGPFTSLAAGCGCRRVVGHGRLGDARHRLALYVFLLVEWWQVNAHVVRVWFRGTFAAVGETRRALGALLLVQLSALGLFLYTHLQLRLAIRCSSPRRLEQGRCVT